MKRGGWRGVSVVTVHLVKASQATELHNNTGSCTVQQASQLPTGQGKPQTPAGCQQLGEWGRERARERERERENSNTLFYKRERWMNSNTVFRPLTQQGQVEGGSKNWGERMDDERDGQLVNILIWVTQTSSPGPAGLVNSGRYPSSKQADQNTHTVKKNNLDFNLDDTKCKLLAQAPFLSDGHRKIISKKASKFLAQAPFLSDRHTQR